MVPNPRFSRWFLPQNAIKSKKKNNQTKGPKEWKHDTCLNLKLIVVLPLKEPTEPCWTKTIQPSPSIFRYSTSSPPACSNLVACRSSIIASKLSIEIVDHKLVPESLPCVQQVPMTKQHSKLLEVKDMTYPQVHCKHLDALLTYLVDHPEPKIGGQVTCKWRHQVETSRKMSLHVHKMPHIYIHLWEHMGRGVKGLQRIGHLGHEPPPPNHPPLHQRLRVLQSTQFHTATQEGVHRAKVRVNRRRLGLLERIVVSYVCGTWREVPLNIHKLHSDPGKKRWIPRGISSFMSLLEFPPPKKKT